MLLIAEVIPFDFLFATQFTIEALLHHLAIIFFFILPVLFPF